jgi:hypothetical protein
LAEMISSCLRLRRPSPTWLSSSSTSCKLAHCSLVLIFQRCYRAAQYASSHTFHFFLTVYTVFFL